MPYETPEYHPAFEEYCETIFELAEDDLEVIQARIAERLDVSRPAVSEMVRRLEKAALVSVGDAVAKSATSCSTAAIAVVSDSTVAGATLTVTVACGHQHV